MFKKELEIAIDIAYSIRETILNIYNSSDFEVEIKSDNSPVTKADKAVDKIIREKLTKSFPTYALLTEESIDDKSRLNNDYVWIIDPIDGTKDFVAKNNEFTVNIGLSYKHEAVLGVILIPVTGEIYYGVKGLGSFYLKDKKSEPIQIHCSNKLDNLTVLISRFHYGELEKQCIEKHSDKIKEIKSVGATIKGCYIASGQADISYRFSSNTKEWDTCAMQAIVEQAGGFILKFDGTPIRYNRDDVYNRDGYIVINRKENFLL